MTFFKEFLTAILQLQFSQFIFTELFVLLFCRLHFFFTEDKHLIHLKIVELEQKCGHMLLTLRRLRISSASLQSEIFS